jgi:hypothetical protein
MTGRGHVGGDQWPVWDEHTGSYMDPASGEVLPDWDNGQMPSSAANSGRRGSGSGHGGMACDSERPTTITHGQSWSLDGGRRRSAQLAFALVRALETSPKPVFRDRIELSTFRFQAGSFALLGPRGRYGQWSAGRRAATSYRLGPAPTGTHRKATIALTWAIRAAGGTE